MTKQRILKRKLEGVQSIIPLIETPEAKEHAEFKEKELIKEIQSNCIHQTFMDGDIETCKECGLIINLS